MATDINDILSLITSVDKINSEETRNALKLVVRFIAELDTRVSDLEQCEAEDEDEAEDDASE